MTAISDLRTSSELQAPKLLEGRAHWRLEKLSKYSMKGVERAVPPRETIRRARRVLKTVGVTTVADVTRLDRIGIPNFMTVRPRDQGPGISYYNGKGTTIDDAHAGAIMEAIERHAGEYCSYQRYYATYNELRSGRVAVNPSNLIVPSTFEYTDDLPIEWVAGFDLIQQQETLVPLNAVLCPYNNPQFPSLFYASTNGLASGNYRTEALCHALCEVIERDAQSLCMAALRIRPAVYQLLSSSIRPADDKPTQRFISLDSLPARADRLVRKMQRAGLSVVLRDLTSTAGIATIDCTLIDQTGSARLRRFGGVGTHPDARVAVCRALTEASQSRLTFIQGGREDIQHIMDRLPSDGPLDSIESTKENGSSAGTVISFKEVPTVENARIDRDVELLLERLPSCGLNQVIAFDLTRPEVQIPVVKVVVPHAETWTVFHLHTGRGALGRRAIMNISNPPQSE